MKRAILAIIMITTSIVFGGCELTDKRENTPMEISIQGFAQKGQLTKGSQLTAFALTDRGVATGNSYPANISDDLGSFALDITTDAPLLELRAEGYYFNEVTGMVSEAPIYLEAIVPTVSSNININLLTTIIKPRIKRLVGSGALYADAVEQAQSELLALFDEDFDIDKFTDADITKSGEADALLLAYACIIQQGRSISEVVTLIQNIAAEFEKSGTLSSETIESIMVNRSDVEPFTIIRNLARFYSEKALQDCVIPPFYRYIDEDYNSDFIIENSSPESVVMPDNTPSHEAISCSYDILSRLDFTAECNEPSATVEKQHFIGDMHIVNVKIPQNEGSTPREITLLFKNAQTGEVLAQREFTQGANVQIVELQIGNGTRSNPVLESFDFPAFDVADRIEVNGQTYPLDVISMDRAIATLPRADSYFFGFPVGSIEKADHIARVKVRFPQEITRTTPIPYYAGLERYNDIPIANPASVKLQSAVAIVGFRLKGFGEVGFLEISGGGADDCLSGLFTYVPDGDNLFYYPDLNPEVVKGTGREMKLTYQTDAGVFLAPLPPIEFKEGFIVKIYNSAGQLTDTATVSGSFSLKAESIIYFTLNK